MQKVPQTLACLSFRSAHEGLQPSTKNHRAASSSSCDRHAHKKSRNCEQHDQQSSQFRTVFWLERKKETRTREYGKNVTLPPWPANLSRPRTNWIGSAPVHMSGCCLGGAVSWWCDELLWVLVVMRWPFISFLVNSCIVHLRALPPACLPTGALLHRCLPSNLSTTTQEAIVKLHRAPPELCTLEQHQ